MHVSLRTSTLIVFIHPYCIRKFTCHVIHWACALSTKMNNGGDGHCYSFAGFNNDLGRSVTPTFLLGNRCYLQLSPHCPKRNKNSMWEVEKNSRFLSREHGILSSCGCKVRETMVDKCELVLWGTSTVLTIFGREHFPSKL